MPRIITLTTDFGLRDAYVAAMKGVLLSGAPEASIVDVTHEVTPQDIMEAAFVLREAVPFFPPGTVHVAVVDPGVGGSRRAVALRSGGHLFVGPDNGLFTLALGHRRPEELAVLDRPAFWRTPEPSATLHGRDVFAPVAAHLASGRALEEVGTPAEELALLHWALPIADEQGVQGWVVHVDRYGNAVTNIGRVLIEPALKGRAVKCYIGSAIVKGIRRTYADVAGGEPVVLFGSGGYLEVAVNGGNAAALFGIRKGTSVNVVFAERRG